MTLSSSSSFSSPKGTPGQRLIKGVAITIAGAVLLKGVRFFLIPLYTRYLTPEDYGIIGAMAPVMGLLTIMAGMGQTGSISFFMFEERAQVDTFRTTLSTVYTNMMIFSSIMVVLFLSFGNNLFLTFFPENPDMFLTFRWLIAASLLLVPTQQVVLIILQAKEARVRIAIIEFAIFILTFCIMLFQLLYRHTGAYGQILASVQGNALIFIPFLIALLAILKKRFSYSFLAAKRTLMYGIPLLPHTLSMWILNLSDRLIISKYCGLSEAGYYTFAYSCGMIMQFIVQGMQQVWGPVFFDVRKNIAESATILGVLATRWSLVLCLIAAIGIMFTPEVVRVVASPKYWTAIPYIIPVIIGYLFNGLYTFPGLILQQMKKNTLLSACTITAAGANIASNLYFVPRYGPVAAAWNTAGTFALMAILYYLIGMRLNPISIIWKDVAAGMVFVAIAVFLTTLPLSISLFFSKMLIAIAAASAFISYLGGPKIVIASLIAKS